MVLMMLLNRLWNGAVGPDVPFDSGSATRTTADDSNTSTTLGQVRASGRGWKAIGFQSIEPARDFRITGVLALVCAERSSVVLVDRQLMRGGVVASNGVHE
jgi:hypothetical protein